MVKAGHCLSTLGAPAFQFYLAVHPEIKTMFAGGVGGRAPPSALPWGSAQRVNTFTAT